MMELLEIAWECQRAANAQFEYCADKDGDEWIMPEELEERKCGDCEDLAFWRRECLITYGVDPDNIRISVGAKGREVHAVADFNDKGVWYRMDHNAPVVRVEPWMMRTPLHINTKTWKIEYIEN